MDVTKKIITPKSRKYSVMRLATEGRQNEQKHLMCSLVFIVITCENAKKAHADRIVLLKIEEYLENYL
jgi:hypothetical protein